jgi:hypothetical protein
MSNPIRQQMTRQAVQENFNAGQPATVENVAKFLPADFDLAPDDLAPFIEPPTPEGPDKAFEANIAALLNGSEPAPPAPPAAPSPRAHFAEAERALGERRVDLVRAKDAEANARRKLAIAITAFQQSTGTKPMTPDELFRANAKSEHEYRMAVARGEIEPPKRPQGIGRSAVDRAAHYGRGGNPAGGGGAYRRGAYPSQYFGAPNYDPRRGPVAQRPKLPSEL